MIKKYRYDGSQKLKLSTMSTKETSLASDRKKAEQKMQENFDKIQDLQKKLYAEKKEGVIFLFQAMDAAGKDGTISTVDSFSVNIDGKEVLIPKVVDGKVVSDEEAIQHYIDTGEHLGIFETPEDATAYAESLHEDQEKLYGEETAEEEETGEENRYYGNPVETTSEYAETLEKNWERENAAPSAPFTETDAAVEESTRSAYAKVAPIISTLGTYAEKIAVKTGATAFFDEAVKAFKEYGGEYINAFLNRSDDMITGKYYDAYTIANSYEKHLTNLNTKKAQLDEANRKYTDLQDKMNRRAAVIGMTNEEFLNLMGFANENPYEH